ncbi:MAG: hypothetical protein FWB88_12340 [Defluviitaleaceae bacterium]|nr:hypothetical protein [Defluviitaleaceae bacterium]MCL2240405.1 hypothetical protein [Defluviitaleaceae bacterium]
MKAMRCNTCKQMYTFDGPPPEACPPCRKRKDALFQTARAMVKENPGITALEVHERTGVPLPNIVRYIETGHFEIVASKTDMTMEEVQKWMRSVKKKGKQERESQARTDDVLPDVSDEPATPQKDDQKIKFIIK